LFLFCWLSLHPACWQNNCAGRYRDPVGLSGEYQAWRPIIQLQVHFVRCEPVKRRSSNAAAVLASEDRTWWSLVQDLKGNLDPQSSLPMTKQPQDDISLKYKHSRFRMPLLAQATATLYFTDMQTVLIPVVLIDSKDSFQPLLLSKCCS
jgi:hypothetical protein